MNGIDIPDDESTGSALFAAFVAVLLIAGAALVGFQLADLSRPAKPSCEAVAADITHPCATAQRKST